MLVKYAMGFPPPSALLLAGNVLLITQLFFAATSCPPPDFPEGGKYVLEKGEYETGMQIKYLCPHGFPMFYQRNTWFTSNKIVTCQSNGKWSEPTVFCDIPAKLKSMTPSPDADTRELLVIDGGRDKCFGPRSGTEEILRFSFDEMVPYAIFISYTKGSGTIKFRLSSNWTFTYDTDMVEANMAFFTIHSNNTKDDAITVEVFSKPNSFISLCEMIVFTKDDKWCDNPPDNSALNGQLEVNHSKAILHCKNGFTEKDGNEVYATCENNNWSYLSLQCVDEKSQKDFKNSACPPPDFPEGGKYEPEKAVYEPGMSIKYTCNNGLAMFVGGLYIGDFKMVSCLSSGKWSEGTPFCDTSAKIRSKNPTASSVEHMKNLILIDGAYTTCFPIPKGTNQILEYSLESQMVVYATTVCWRNGRATIRVNVTETEFVVYTQYFGFDKYGCMFSFFPNNKEKTDYVTLQVSPDKNSTILMCEISVYVKEEQYSRAGRRARACFEKYSSCNCNSKEVSVGDEYEMLRSFPVTCSSNDNMCERPPDNSVPNGHLEVGRSKAVLHCNEGFKEKYDKDIYATCQNNIWSYMNLQCIETSCDPEVGNVSSSDGEWKNDEEVNEFYVGTKRTLQCEPGYHSEGEPITVSCLENRTWTKTSATCKMDAPQNGYKITAIVVGLVIVIVILALVGLTIFLIRRKKPIALYVMFKPGRNNSLSSSRFVNDNRTSLYEAENSSECVIKESETTG